MSKPWKKFSVGVPSSPPRWQPNCQYLNSVAHVTHIETALRIVEDRRLRADLVFDKSKLNNERIRVVWLSPNNWDGAGGFRYGNIRFHFDWATLVEGKRSYWVESIAYGIEACRILITDADYSHALEPYDPTVGDGPWWIYPLDGEHYWNGEYCLEIMLEGDIDLERASKVDFVRHHSDRCSIDYRSCRSRGYSADVGGAEFVAAVVSRGLSLALPGIVLEDESLGPKPGWALETAVSRLLRRCDKIGVNCTGIVGHKDPAASALARAVLASLGNAGIAKDFARLTAQFMSKDDLQSAIVEAVAASAGLPDSSLLLSD